MKINTISAYVLVYLLARGHWNLMVPVRADVEGDGSSGMSSADGGSSSGTPAEGSSLATPASESGSTASADAGLTAGEGSGHVAGGSDADGSAGSSAEGASSGDASTDADAGHVPRESGDAGSSAEANNEADAGQVKAGEVLLNGLYPDLFTSGLYSHKEHGETKPELVAKRQETLLLAEKARKAAEDLRKAAEKLSKEADELTKAVEDNVKLEDDVNLDVLSAKIDAFDQKVGSEMKKADDLGKDLDMTYYSGFPNGWHSRGIEAIEQLSEREKKIDGYMLYYDGFPNGWHIHNDGTEEQFVEREKKWLNNIEYYNGFPDGWHFGNPLVLRDIRRHELKGEIAAKKKEIESLNKVIIELTTQMEKIDAEVKKLEEEHNDLVQKLLGFDALLIKLYKADAEGNLVLMEENTDFEKKKAQGDLRFVIKDGAKCTKVMYGVHELWKKGEQDVQEPKLVAFNDTVGVLAVRDENRAVLYKKETNSDKWYYHNTVLRRTAGTPSRTAAQTGSSAGSTLASSSALAGSKMNLEASSTGTPETAESLDETASVASGEGSDANETDSGTALRGSTGISPGEGMAGEGSAASDYSSVFMD